MARRLLRRLLRRLITALIVAAVVAVVRDRVISKHEAALDRGRR
jgi:hypothetical protein